MYVMHRRVEASLDVPTVGPPFYLLQGGLHKAYVVGNRLCNTLCNALSNLLCHAPCNALQCYQGGFYTAEEVVHIRAPLLNLLDGRGDKVGPQPACNLQPQPATSRLPAGNLKPQPTCNLNLLTLTPAPSRLPAPHPHACTPTRLHTHTPAT